MDSFVELRVVIVILSLCWSQADRVSPWTLQRRWVSANFGSTLAAPPVFSDFNRDGHLDAVVLTFDGELIVLDASGHGEALPHSDWPAYHHGHHFFAAPILIDMNRDGVDEIVIVSFNGSIFAYSWQGLLLNSTTLPQFHVEKNLLLSQESELLSILNSAHGSRAEPSMLVRPEVYSSPLLVDVNGDGRVEELVLVTNYGVLQRRAVEKDFNLLLGANLVFNISSFSTVRLRFSDVTKRQSEFPAYFLSDPVLFMPPGQPVHVTAASTSGKLYVWRGPNLDLLPDFPYMYGSSTQSPAIIWPNNSAAVVMLDFSGNILAMDLRGKEIWESKVKGAPTAARRWFLGKQEALVLGTSRGFLYALNASDGRPLPNFPSAHPGLRFSSSPLLLTDSRGRELVGLLGQDSDRLLVADLAAPNRSFVSSFAGERSHLGPTLLPYKLSAGCALFLPFADGAVGCYAAQTTFTAGESTAFQLVNLYPYQTLSMFAGADFRFGGTGSTLFVFGEVVTVILHISDNCPGNKYRLRIYLSGRLVHTMGLGRAGFHHVTFTLDPVSTEGMLLLEIQSSLNGELVRDHIWLQQATFTQRHQVVLTTFFVSFLLFFFLLLCLHAWRHRNTIGDCCEVLTLSVRRLQRRLRSRPEPCLPLCYRPAETSVWCRPCRLVGRAVGKVVGWARERIEARKQRLY